MAYTAGNVMDLAATLLNDTSKTLFTYVVQLPLLKAAQRDLQNDFILNEAKIAFERSAAIDVAAGATTLTLPADFFLPVVLHERRDGSTNERDYVEMRETNIEPIGPATLNLGLWSFRESELKLNPSTEAKEVKLTYWRMAPPATSESTSIAEDGALNVLAYKTAHLLAKHITHNVTRAGELIQDYGMAFDSLIALYVKNNQGLRMRRKPFRSGRVK